MLYNFDIGSGDKSPQTVNNFNDACNSDTFLAGCVLEGGVNCSISPVVFELSSLKVINK